MEVGRLVKRLRGAFRPEAEEDFFDPRFFSRLDRVRLRVGRVTGARTGETPVRGMAQSSGVEIESFKAYAAGDDIRYLDWSALGRLDQLLTRRFVAEREVPVHVLLDGSASMGVPAADAKFAFAVQLSAALAYIALNNNDSVRVAALRRAGGEARVEESRRFRHRGRYLGLKPFLSTLTCAGENALLEGASTYLAKHAEGGIAFVVSDFLAEPEQVERMLMLCRSKRIEVRAIHVVGRTERDLVGFRGRYRLRDAETGATRAVTLSEGARRRYRADFEARMAALRSFCHRNGIGHAIALAEAGVERCLTATMPAAGMLKLR